MSMRARQHLPWLVVVVVVVGAGGWFYFAHRQTPQPSEPITPPMAAAASVANAPTASVSPSSQVHSVPSATAPVADDGTVAVPSRYQLPGVTRVHTGKSFADWQAQFPADTRRLMADFSKHYFGVYLVSSPAQVAWMAAHGYPMPEDLAAAQGMSDQGLLDLAQQGNVKAAFLLRSRDIREAMQQISQYRASGKSSQDFWTDDPLAHTIATRDRVLDPSITASDSGFKAFLDATDGPTTTTNQAAIEAQVIAGLDLANLLGDRRSMWLLGNYVGNDPQRKAIVEGVSAAGNNYSNLLSKMGEPGAGCLSPFSIAPMPNGDGPAH